MREQLTDSRQSTDAVRILVADDESDIRETLRLILEETGYPLVEATDGSAVLDELRTTPHRMIVLLDLLMPKLDGEAVLRAVLAEPRLVRQHAFIVLTAANENHVSRVEPFQSLLPLRIVHKPFDMDDVLDAVRQAAARLSASSPTE